VKSENNEPSDGQGRPGRLQKKLNDALPTFVDIRLDVREDVTGITLANSRFANKALIKQQIAKLMRPDKYSLIWID